MRIRFRLTRGWRTEWRLYPLSGVALIICLMAAPPAFAQQEPATRAEADRQRREEKAAHVEPYKPGGFERAMHFVEEKAIFIVGREGFYPKLGSLTTGSGFAYGAGFRDRDLFDNKGTLDLWAATSTRRYWATEARLTFPKLAHKRLLRRDVGRAPRLPAGGLLRHRSRLGSRRPDQLRHPIGPLRRPRRRAPASDRARRRRRSSI